MSVIYRFGFCQSLFMRLQQVGLCRSSLLTCRNVRWPCRMLPPGESWWVCRRDRQMDRRTDARPLHYAFAATQTSSL